VSASVSARRENVHPTYRPDIDGLRAVAVLSVVVFHAFPRALPGGFIGVDIFFVISGYLISRIIIESLEQGRFSFAGFYARRIKRLYPALLLVLVAVLAFGWIALFAKEYEQLGKHTAAAAVFISNLVLWSESGYFDNASITKPLLHLWSLGVEEQFYIFWPLLLWLGWRLRFNLLLVAACIGILSFGANVLATTHSPPAAFYSPFTRFWEPMVGAILAYVAAHHRFRRAPVAGATAAAETIGELVERVADEVEGDLGVRVEVVRVGEGEIEDAAPSLLTSPVLGGVDALARIAEQPREGRADHQAALQA